jgi:hypothetical protein
MSTRPGSNGVTSYIDLWSSSRSVHRIKPKSCEDDARPKQDFAKPCCHFLPPSALSANIAAQRAPRRHSRDLVNKNGPSWLCAHLSYALSPRK